MSCTESTEGRRDLRAELRNGTAAGAGDHTWRPKPGDVIVGTLISKKAGQTPKRRTPCLILLIADEEGDQPTTVWAYHKVLLDELNKLDPQPGERIAIEYTGRRTSKRGVPFHHYVVIVDGGDSEVGDGLPL